MEDYFTLISNLSIVDIFGDLYPDNKIESEFNPRTKRELYKTHSIYVDSKSKLPQLYFNERGMFGANYFCFESGQRGHIPNLLKDTFIEHNYFPKKSLSYLLKKLNLKLSFSELKLFLEGFNNLGSKSFYDTDIWDNSLLGNNPTILNDGSWINDNTGKWEGWSKDWE